jgi:AGCS family alanine or glycine:cation symporter
VLIADATPGIGVRITEAIGTFNNDFFWSWVLIPLLVVVSLYVTIRTGVVQIRLFPEMFRVLRSRPEIAPDGKRAVSSLQAFMISAAARIGTGNIVGVAVAISLGGPGAVFWMWLMATVVAGTSFIESTLAQLYKVRDSTGYRGGPAYYMERGLGQRWMGVLFAVVLIMTFPMVFNAVQSNTIAGAVANSSASLGGGSGVWLSAIVGAVVVVLTALVIFGGVRRIAHTAQALIPAFAAIYLVLGVVILAMNFERIPTMFALIFEHAFGIREFAAAGLATVIIQGVRRGMFSNEAGLGSAPIAAASASVTHPAKQGLVQSLGVYFDTLVVCSITAFIILIAAPHDADHRHRRVHVGAGQLLLRRVEPGVPDQQPRRPRRLQGGLPRRQLPGRPGLDRPGLDAGRHDHGHDGAGQPHRHHAFGGDGGTPAQGLHRPAAPGHRPRVHAGPAGRPAGRGVLGARKGGGRRGDGPGLVLTRPGPTG